MEDSILFENESSSSSSFDSTLTLVEEKAIIEKGLINKPLQPSDLVVINAKFGGLTSANRNFLSRNAIKKTVDSIISKKSVTLGDLKLELSTFGKMKTLKAWGYRKPTGNPKRPYSYHIVFTSIK